MGRGHGRQARDARRLPGRSACLPAPPADYRASARSSAGAILFTGRLEHDEVAELVPSTDSMVVPSTFPEAFGMVAAEAAASGVLPVCARHSGLEEVTATLSKDVPAAAPFLSFDLGPDAVPEIASRLDRWLETSGEQRTALELALAASADHHWSWEGVARDVIRASAGEIRPLPPSGP
ncbi:MAG: glycosyltransferase [Solirubrobacterales bacterium]